jgi:serine/threonine protein kinase
MTRVTAGPLLWMAPEVFRGQQYTKAIDSFSFGVVMYEVLTAQPPHFAAGMELEPYARAVALRGYRAPLPDRACRRRGARSSRAAGHKRRRSTSV